jgi:hypothetical protein
MNTHDTEVLQHELNDLNTSEDNKPEENQSVEVYVTGFALFADVKL